MTSRLFLNWSEPLLLATKSSCLPLPANRKHLVQNLGFLMTDYYPMIARCVADLEENAAVRHEFYWLARAELAVQLSGLDPPITQSEITCERLALDEALRKVEAERFPVTEAQRLDPIRARPSTPKSAARSEENRQQTSTDDLRLCADMRLISKERQEQASDTISFQPATRSTRPLIVTLGGALLVIALAITLYGQGHHFTALLFGSPVAQPHHAANFSPITYYVGQLRELISTADRRVQK